MTLVMPIRRLVLSILTVLLVSIYAGWMVHAGPTAGLVAYYPFDGNANDATGRGRDGTIHGAVLAADRFGNPNSCYQFDGLDDFIDTYALDLPTAARAVALWFYADDVAKPVLLSYGGGECGTSWIEGMNSAFQFYYVSSHCNVNSLAYGYFEAPVRQWIHVVITTDATGTQIWIDGVPAASNTNPIDNTQVVGADLSIGVSVSPTGQAPYTDGNSGYFHGRIDDVRIYDRSLTCEEIQELYRGTSIPGEVLEDTWANRTTLQWQPVPCATEYHIYTGLVGDLSAGDYGSCADATDSDRSDTTLLDANVPDMGQAHFYLITAENALGQEGTSGYATAGERSILKLCP